MLSSLYASRLERLRRGNNGFTLIELLIVVIIIGVLAAIALPIFINQQRAAIDASVKADVHNTAAQIVGWRAQSGNATKVEANTTAYTAAGGTVTKSRSGSVLGVQTKADGSFTVCAFDGGGNNYATAEKAWFFDSNTGHFTDVADVQSSPSCAGAVDASGNDISTTPVAAKLTGSTTLTSAVKGTQYSAALSATGNPAATFSIPLTGTGSLPSGLALNNGVISGTPLATGTYTISVTAKNFTGSDTQNYTLTVLAPAQFTGLFALPNATQDTQYSTTLVATGNPTPTFDIANGSALPTGLNLNKTTGVISGTPSSAGNSSFSLVAKNSVGNDTEAFTLTVISKDVAPTFAAGSTVTLPAFTRGTQASSYTVVANGYPAPTLTVDSGTVPTGMTFDTTTGVLSGTPNGGAVSGQFIVRAHNRTNTDATEAINYTVQYPATLTTTSLDSGYTSSAYSFKVVAAGNPMPTVTVDKTTLPTGLTATSNSDGTATISGTPTTAVVAKSVKITVSNGVGSAVVTNLPLTIASSTVYSEDFSSYSSNSYTTAGWVLGGGTCYGSHYVQYASYSNLFFTGNGTQALAFDSCVGANSLSATYSNITLAPGTYVISGDVAGTTTTNANGGTLTVLNGGTTLASTSGTASNSFKKLTTTVTVTSTTVVKIQFGYSYSGYSGSSTTPGFYLDNILVKHS